MIVGVSLILCAFTYLAYRRLCSTTGGPGTGGASDPADDGFPLSLWPFVATALTPVGAHHHHHQSSPRSNIFGASPSPSSHLSGLGRYGSSSAATPSSPPTPPPGSSIVTPPTFALPISPEATPKAEATILRNAVPEISLDGSYSDDDDDDDAPPSFPAMNSNQRASAPSSIPAFGASSQTMMPPPPLPRKSPNQSAASLARQPPTSRLTVVGAGASGVAAGSGLTLPRQRGSSNNSKSRKVILNPGHSPLDWARLQKSGVDLRGLPHPHLIKVPPSELAKHRKAPDDIWMALRGKVYNITAYIPFHPGGEKELLRCAGKDGTNLFDKTHPWVNVEGMLDECLIGILVSEEEASSQAASALEQVD